jgi:hypothetical protein
MTIVTSHYRYKRPARKRKAVALEVPAVVKAASKPPKAEPLTKSTPPAATDDRTSAIVTIRGRKQAKHADVPDLAPEALQRRSNAGELVRRASGRDGRTAALALLRHRTPACARRGSGSAAAGLPVLVPARHLRPLRQGTRRTPRSGSATCRSACCSPACATTGCGGRLGRVELVAASKAIEATGSENHAEKLSSVVRCRSLRAFLVGAEAFASHRPDRRFAL